MNAVRMGEEGRVANKTDAQGGVVVSISLFYLVDVVASPDVGYCVQNRKHRDMKEGSGFEVDTGASVEDRAFGLVIWKTADLTCMEEWVKWMDS